MVQNMIIEKDLITDDGFYLIDDVKIGFLFDEEYGGYIISSGSGRISELHIPATINGLPVIDIDGDIVDTLHGFDKIITNDNPYFKVIDGVLFSGDSKRLIIYPPEKKNEFYEIPASIKSISDGAFCCNQHLKRLVIPKGTEYIVQYALGCCKNLEEIWIPKSLKQVMLKAFIYCNSLKDIYFEGNEAEWRSIDFTYCNEALTNAAVHLNSQQLP